MAPKVYKCGICDESIGKKACVQCNVCAYWIHQSCTEMTDGDFEILSKNKFFKFICCNCESTIDKERSLYDEIRAMNKKLDDVFNKSQEDIKSLKVAFSDAVNVIKSDMGSVLTEMKSDISNCNEKIKTMESAIATKFSLLEKENHVLYRKLNRSNIVIRGLPAGLPNLVSVVVALGAFFKISVERNDINHVCYLNNKRLVLVVFNNVMIRDDIMKQYFKTRTLRRPDIIGDILIRNDGGSASSSGGKITDRVFLNDHFSPIAGKLNAECRKLLQDKIISKYKIFNNDKLRAVLTLPNGDHVEVHDVSGCLRIRSERSL